MSISDVIKQSIDDTKRDINQVVDAAKRVAKFADKAVDALPWIGVGAGALGITTGKLGPMVTKTAKTAGIVAKGLVKSGKAILASTPLIAAKTAGTAGLTLVGAEVAGRQLLKRPGLVAFNVGLFTGEISDRDRELLNRREGFVKDLLSGRSPLRLAARLYRPSWVD